MQDVISVKLKYFTQPTELFTHNNEVGPMEIADDKTTRLKITNKMALRCHTAPNYPRRTHPWQRPQLLQNRLRCDPVLTPVTPPA